MHLIDFIEDIFFHANGSYRLQKNKKEDFEVFVFGWLKNQSQLPAAARYAAVPASRPPMERIYNCFERYKGNQIVWYVIFKKMNLKAYFWRKFTITITCERPPTQRGEPPQ